MYPYLSVNFSINIVAGLVFVVASVLLIPQVGKVIGAAWLYIVGLSMITFSQCWKIARVLK